MDIKLIPQHKFVKFDQQLPVYNWLYPLSGQETTKLPPDAVYGRLETAHVKRRALYFHVPFCETICSFCPFIRGAYHGDEIVEAYTRALIREVELKARYPALTSAPIDTIFFGGGTPSILGPAQILRIGAAIRKHFDLRELREFSFEMEVKSVTREKMQALKEIGVTHARFGLQTFNEKYRKAFALTASIDDIHRALGLMREHFPYSSFDILYGMDGQTIEEFAADVEAATAMPTTNIDFYPINNVVTQPRLHKTFEQMGRKPASAMTKHMMNAFLNEAARACGFVPHNGHGWVRASAEEIAANPIVSSSYDFRYHLFVYGYYEDELIGFGNSAISQLGGFSIRNAEEREDYIRSLLDRDTWKEGVIDHGVPYERGVVFRLPYHGSCEKRRIDWDRVPAETKETLSQFVDAGLVEDAGDEYRITRVGWYWYVNMMYLLSPKREQEVLAGVVRGNLKDTGRREGPTRTLPLLEAQV